MYEVLPHQYTTFLSRSNYFPVGLLKIHRTPEIQCNIKGVYNANICYFEYNVCLNVYQWSFENVCYNVGNKINTVTKARQSDILPLQIKQNATNVNDDDP